MYTPIHCLRSNEMARDGEVLATDAEYWNATDVDEPSTFYKTWMVLGRAERCAVPHVLNFDAKSLIASLMTREVVCCEG
jgi:hypothetical protein